MFFQLSAVHHIKQSFDEASSFSRYHPSKGYSWDFKSQRTDPDKNQKGKDEKPREEPSSLFQRQRVDMLLGELVKQFPLSTPAQTKPVPPPSIKTEPDAPPANNSNEKQEKQENNKEKIGPPPDKKPRVN